jgi:hypothetical protein
VPGDRVHPRRRVHTAARNLMERIDPATAGLWPRATALLARQALEAALDDFWRRRSPGMELCSMRAQLLCLPYFLQASSPKPQADDLAQRVSYAWAGLSGACHQHPYELPPTSAELLGWLGTVEEFVADVGAG